MWSDRYYYLNIYADEHLSKACSTLEIRLFLSKLNSLQLKTAYQFTNKPDFPFIDMTLLFAKSPDNWSIKNVDPVYTNLITIVCRKDHERSFEKVKPDFIRIAEFLGWKLVDECTDDGIDDYQLWPPLD